MICTAGSFPAEWRTLEIAELAVEVGSGLTPRGGQSSYLTRGIPLIRSQNVRMNRLDLNDVAYVSEETHRAMARSSVRPGDVLLNITGASIGRVATVPQSLTSANVNQHVCRIRLRRDFVLPDFASYFLSSKLGQAQIWGSQHGATRQGLNFANVRRLWLPLPPIDEQRNIVKILNAIQSAVQATEKVIAAARQLKQSLMRHLFTYGPVPLDQSNKIQLQATELGLVPNHWNCGRLGDFITLQRGFDLPSHSRSKGAVPVISSGGVTGWHSEPRVSGPGVVIGRYGSIGEVHYINQDFWPLNTTLFIKSFGGNDPKFVSYFLKTIDFRSFNDKTSIPGVNRNHLHNIRVAMPPLAEQHRIASVLTVVDEKTAAEDKVRAGIDVVFRTVLRELMGGTIRVYLGQRG